MRLFKIIFTLLIISSHVVCGQTKADLEEQRRKAMEEIAYVDNLLSNTVREKSASISALKILGNKVKLREKIITGMGAEIGLLNERIELNRLAIDMMENDLILLKNDYTQAIINSYKAEKINPEIIYILSAKDFNQGYKRLKYLQQVTKFRRNEALIISELKERIEATKERLENDLLIISDLQLKEVQQKSLLQGEQLRKQKMIKSLGNKEKQLKKELEEKKRIAKRIENEISRILEEERKRNVGTSLTPEQKIIGENFSENKGRLPWPVERGTITSHYGVHQHPVLKYVKEENHGIDITSSGKIKARSIFKGEVTAITTISGANMTVIIRHGKYCSVYNNLVNVKVKKGDKVEIKEEIGDVYSDPADNFNCTLKFMIFEQSFLDPEQWIAKI